MEIVEDFFTDLYTFDIVYLVFTLLSLITCTKKGFLLSILSASKWLLAYVVTLFLFPKVKPYFEDIIDSEYVLDIAVGMGLFISDSTDAMRVVTELMAGHGHGALVYLHHKMPSWGVSAKTFSLRCHKMNAINYQAVYNGFFQEKYSQTASETLFIVEEIST